MMRVTPSGSVNVQFFWTFCGSIAMFWMSWYVLCTTSLCCVVRSYGEGAPGDGGTAAAALAAAAAWPNPGSWMVSQSGVMCSESQDLCPVSSMLEIGLPAANVYRFPVKGSVSSAMSARAPLYMSLDRNWFSDGS